MGSGKFIRNEIKAKTTISRGNSKNNEKETLKEPVSYPKFVKSPDLSPVNNRKTKESFIHTNNNFKKSKSDAKLTLENSIENNSKLINLTLDIDNLNTEKKRKNRKPPNKKKNESLVVPKEVAFNIQNWHNALSNLGFDTGAYEIPLMCFSQR